MKTDPSQSLSDAQVLPALPAFEAAARLGSLTRAAQELGVTQRYLLRRRWASWLRGVYPRRGPKPDMGFKRSELVAHVSKLTGGTDIAVERQSADSVTAEKFWSAPQASSAIDSKHDVLQVAVARGPDGRAAQERVARKSRIA